MAVVVPLAEDRDEAEDVALEAEPLAIGLDHPLPRELGRAVERRLDRERGVLRGRDDGRVAVDRARGGEADPPHPGLPHGLEHAVGGACVLVEVALGVLQAEPDVRVGREMEDEVAAFHRRRERRRVEDVVPDKLEPRVLEGVLQELLEARGQVVVGDHVVPGLQQPVHEVAPDEPRSARDEESHVWSCGSTRRNRPPGERWSL